MKSSEQRTQTILEEFTKRFQQAPTMLAVGPGRVNLIGEHTDYNDGFVLPVAIKRDIRIALRPREDRRVKVYSLEYDGWYEFNLDELRYNQELLWSNYVQGVAWALQELGIPLRGFDGVISGNVPRASGLSSSAALEVATATAFLAASDQTGALDPVKIALAAQRAENKFVGVNCGIMDQYISVLGQEGQALLIDCRSLEYQLIPVPKEAALVIGNTKASRSLAGSAYNERRRQCEEGVAILQGVLPDVIALRDVTSAQLEEHKGLLSETVYRRCRHVVGAGGGEAADEVVGVGRVPVLHRLAGGGRPPFAGDVVAPGLNRAGRVRPGRRRHHRRSPTLGGAAPGARPRSDRPPILPSGPAAEPPWYHGRHHSPPRPEGSRWSRRRGGSRSRSSSAAPTTAKGN